MAVHPGLISTNLARHVDPEMLRKMTAPNAKYMKSIPQGAATTVWAATAKQWEGTGEQSHHSIIIITITHLGNVRNNVA